MPTPATSATAAVQYEKLADAAARLGVHQKTLRRRIATGQLVAYRVGPLIRLDPADVDKLLRPIPNASAA